MQPRELPSATDRSSGLYAGLYRIFNYLGVMTVFGTLLHGFRYDSAAPVANYGFNLLLFLGFTIPHLVMTRSWFKQTVWGDAGGSPRERRFYIFVTIVTWMAVFALHKPVPGGALMIPESVQGAVQFAGQVGMLFAFFLFFEGKSLQDLNMLLGAQDATISYSHGPSTSLFTEGSYSQVRHSMYRGAVIWGAVLAADSRQYGTTTMGRIAGRDLRGIHTRGRATNACRTW